MLAETKIPKRSLLDITVEYYGHYGRHTIEQRALVDYRDGLKPVARRVLWAMGPLLGNLNLKPSGAFKKSARIVGDTMGKYHPHGDQSIYNALVTQTAEVPVPLIEGAGNFGGPTDNPAAMRYTEARVSKYGWDTLFSPDYLDTISSKLVENFDGSEKEPYYFPATLPNILINGSYGIATGITGIIPPIHLESLLPFIEKHIEGKPVRDKTLKKLIRFNNTYGGQNNSTEEQMDQFLSEGYGTLRFGPTYTIDYDKRLVIVTEIPPMCNWDSVVKRLASKKMEKYVAEADDDVSKKERKTKGSRAIKFVIRLKNSVDRDDIKGVAAQVADCFITKTYTSAMRWTTRVSAEKVILTTGTLSNLICLWTDYRVQLEIDARKGVIKSIDHDLMRQDVFALAADNVEVLAKIIKNSKTPIPDMIKRFPVLDETKANIILDMQLRRLARINKHKIGEEIDRLKKARRVAASIRDNPGPKVITDINNALKIALPKKV